MAWAIILFASLSWTFWAGKDLGWDVANHHLYLPFSLLTGRYDTDLYAAGPQSYQNPLGYLPFYLMAVVAEWPAWVVGATFAFIHGLGIVAVFQIALIVWSRDRLRVFWAALAAAMAWISPAFLVVVGTSSIDPITAVLILLALLLVIGEEDGLESRSAFKAGLLVGLAFALKQSNAVFALSIGAVALWRVLMTQGRLRAMFSLVAGGLLATCSAVGWWAWMLWEKFNNPIYPLYNNVFHSPYASQDPMLAMRFMAHSPFDYVSRIWEMAWFKEFVSMESILPDIRPVLLFALAIMLFLVTVGRFVVREVQGSRSERSNKLASVDVQLALFVLVSYFLWMKTSGNARYVIPLFLIIGLLLVRLLWALMPLKIARSLCLIVIILQLSYFASANVRLVPKRWDAGPYFNIEVPKRLIDKPYLHVSLGLQSFASIAPFINAHGAMMNPVGQVSLPTSGPLGKKVLDLLAAWRGRTRILMPTFDRSDVDRRVAIHSLMQSILYRLGLDVNWSDCLPIRGPGFNLLSCAAVMPVKSDQSFESQRILMDEAFEKVEAICPMIFSPRTGVSERGVGKWQRFYANTDATVTISQTDDVIFVSHGRSNIDRVIGSINDVRAGKGKFECKMWSLRAPD